MVKARYVYYLLLVILLGLQGCLPQAAPQTVPQTGLEPSAAVPEIRSVEVLQSDQPQQALVFVQAVLPNTCARLGEASIDRQGQIFTVSLPAEQATGENCQAVSLNQDRIIRLPVDSLSPGSYLVLVNGVLGSFSIKAAAQPAAAQVTAAVTPTASPTDAPAQLPTPTPTAVLPPAEPLLPSPTPTVTPLALAVGDDPGTCVNRAVLYGTLTVPDDTPFAPGSKFTKTWMVMNTGTCIWGPGYQLVFAGGDPLGAPQKTSLPKAGPKQVVQVSVAMTAPVAPQRYESNWAIETPEGYRFGLGTPATTPLAVKINVVPIVVGLPAELECGALATRDMEAQVLEQINNVRTQYGLSPVELVEDISKVALKHSLEMACFNRDSHRGRDGMLYNIRLQRDGVLFTTSNEILYAGNGGPKGAISWWMNSPIHRSIILSDQYTQVGIGYVYYDRNPYKLRITVNFIHP
jgi:uncharacterized protein YkwD